MDAINQTESQRATSLNAIAPELGSLITDFLNNDGKITISEVETILQEHYKKQNSEKLDSNSQNLKSIPEDRYSSNSLLSGIELTSRYNPLDYPVLVILGEPEKGKILIGPKNTSLPIEKFIVPISRLADDLNNRTFKISHFPYDRTVALLKLNPLFYSLGYKSIISQILNTIIMDNQTKPNQTVNSVQSDATAVKTPSVPFPLKNLVGQEAGKIYGISLDSLSPLDKYNLEKGNYTEGIHKFTYTNQAGNTSEMAGRFYLTRGDNNTVEAKFLPVLAKPEIKEWLQGGYKLQEGEREKLLAGEVLSFTNKPLIRNPEGPEPKRSDKANNYLAKLDNGTNQVVVRNMDQKSSFKFNTTIYSREIPPADLTALKSGKSINIEDPIFNKGGLQKGTFSIIFDPVRNNIVVQKSERIQDKSIKADKKQGITTSEATGKKSQGPKPSQDIVKLSPKASRGPKI